MSLGFIVLIQRVSYYASFNMLVPDSVTKKLTETENVIWIAGRTTHLNCFDTLCSFQLFTTQ